MKSVTITADDNWTYTFDNLLKYRDGGTEINYSIDEDPVAGYVATYNGYNITNTHTPEKTSINITKTWIDNDDEDELRPTSIVVNVYADGEYLMQVEISVEDDWFYIIENLDKYANGKEISYTVEEEGLMGYEPEYNYNSDGIEIVNVHTPQKGDTDIIDPPHTSVEDIDIYHYPLEYVVIYDDKKKRMI